jgi:hypothetical protein
VQTWDNLLTPSVACVVHHHIAFWVIKQHESMHPTDKSATPR